MNDVGLLALSPILACFSVAVIKHGPDQVGRGDSLFGLHSMSQCMIKGIQRRSSDRESGGEN